MSSTPHGSHQHDSAHKNSASSTAPDDLIHINRLKRSIALCGTCITGVSSRTGKPGVMSSKRKFVRFDLRWWPWTNLLGLLSMRRNNGKPSPVRRQSIATSPPLGGASEYFHGRSSDFAGSSLLAGLPRASRSSVILGFRTCLPLRGSSGLSPDSLFILLAEKPWSPHHIWAQFLNQDYSLWITNPPRYVPLQLRMGNPRRCTDSPRRKAKQKSQSEDYRAYPTAAIREARFLKASSLTGFTPLAEIQRL